LLFSFYERYSLPVSRTASGENGQNNAGIVRLQGIGSFCTWGGLSASGQNNSGPGFGRLQGKGLVRKEAFLLTAILVTFGASKVTALPAAIERADAVSYNFILVSQTNVSTVSDCFVPRNEMVLHRKFIASLQPIFPSLLIQIKT
jgi:hypothetical protein